MDGHFEVSSTKKQTHHESGKEFTGGRSGATIDMLPDVALLVIFDFYLNKARIKAWHTLVHVCRNWRSIVFGSSRRLNLRLFCTARTPSREILDVWPPLPIVISDLGSETWGWDNIFAALEHNDRIRKLDLTPSSSQFEKLLPAMQQPFPKLIRMELKLQNKTKTIVSPIGPIVPDSFLGGSASRLQALYLDSVSFPGLPKFLLSATHIIHLELRNIPYSGYFSPEAMVTGLAALTRLKTLIIRFGLPRLPLDGIDLKSQHPPSQRRVSLPVLTELNLRGYSEYMEDLVAQIGAPLIDRMWTSIFDSDVLRPDIFHQEFSTPQLSQFISRTPTFEAFDEARVVFSNFTVSVNLPRSLNRWFNLEIFSFHPERQLFCLAEACSSSFPQALISAVERLYIESEASWRLNWSQDFGDSECLEFLRPFIAVKHLYISRELVSRIAHILQGLVGERVREVLPALETLSLEGTPSSRTTQDNIARIVAARQFSGHPISISRWETNVSS